MPRRAPGPVAARLESLFSQYHHAELISPDPLECVCRYRKIADREIVGLLAATVAFGRVSHILVSVERLLSQMGPEPARWLSETASRRIALSFDGWRHRWATGDEVANLLLAVRGVVGEWGSLGAAWRGVRRADDEDVHETLIRWVGLLDQFGLAVDNSLVPRPERASASKRLHLFLRWMVRRDEVDPGGWDETPARLLVPLDVHMHRMARLLGATRRRAADLRTAREITAWFRLLDPQDPVRFDFALTRLPIHDGMSAAETRRALLCGDL